MFPCIVSGQMSSATRTLYTVTLVGSFTSTSLYVMY